MSTKPNVLLIICHDLGRHLGCYGEAAAAGAAGAVGSPHLDKLAAEGVRFTSSFTSSTPCSPARGCLMTGQYAHSQGLIGLAHRGWEYTSGTRTVAHDFAGAGYGTHLFGLQHETRRPGALGYQHIWRQSARSDRVADQVIEFLSSDSARTGPFFLCAGLEEVHLPFDRDFYQPADPAEVALPAFLPDNDVNRRQMACFHGAIGFLDRHVGRIVSALDGSPPKDNTIVLFTTDHGMAFPRAKSTLYDAGIGTALIVRMPPNMGPAGLVRDELLAGIDLRPTLCDLAGITVPTQVQGWSFAALLTEGDYQPNEEVFSEKNFHNHFDPLRCIRTRTHKYIRNFRDAPNLLLPSDIADAFPTRARRRDADAPRPREELYDLISDPDEEHNLADSPAHAALREQLADRLRQWMRQTADPMLTADIIPWPPEQF